MASTVRLRASTPGERRRLQDKLTNRRLAVRLHRRYRIVAELACGRLPRDVADRVGCHVNMVYEWLHRFNASGFAAPAIRGAGRRSSPGRRSGS